jgi:hypothetical protein
MDVLDDLGIECSAPDHSLPGSLSRRDQESQVHVFVDESVRRRYLIAAVIVDQPDLARVRRELRAMRKPGQRRVHFAKESDSRRRSLVTALLGLDLRVRVYECAGQDAPARARCLGQLVLDIVDLGAERLVLETLDTQVRADVATIRAQLTPGSALAYEHRRAHEEPALWAADAAAWCYGAGGDWRRRMAPMLDKAVRLDPG